MRADRKSVLDADIVKFMIVRHPFDRLVSAYVDRILDTETDQVCQVQIIEIMIISLGQISHQVYAQI